MVYSRYRSLPIEDPRNILRRLADYSERTESWKLAPIEVTVTLADGSSAGGRLIMAGRDGNIEIVLLSAGDENNPALHYIRLPDVSSIRIHQVSAAEEALASPSGPVDPSKAPTRLQLKRMMEEIPAAISGASFKIEADWDSLPDSPEGRLRISELAEGLSTSLKNLLQAKDARDSMKSVKRLVLTGIEGSRLRGQRQGADITFSHDFRRPLPDPLDSSIVNLLESVL